MIRFPAGQKAGGTLHLTISGAHAPMLQHVAPDIVTAVNRFFGYAAIAGVRMTHGQVTPAAPVQPPAILKPVPAELRSEEHTSELQSLMRISYAVFCLKKKKPQHKKK